ncbi:glycosyl hydrolase family 61 [Alternaria sp. MG1]|nr:glycosyl hydrolase family 61 [Alternaria sp. MG1]
MRQYLFFFFIPPLVVGHGFVQNATIGGKEYDPPRISREIQGNFPIENVKLIDLECGGNTTGGIIGSRPAPLHAPAAAGSTVNLRWTAWPESHQGPVITYMARCPDTGEHVLSIDDTKSEL